MRALGGKNCRSNVKPGIHTGDRVEFNTVDFVAGVYGALAATTGKARSPTVEDVLVER